MEKLHAHARVHFLMASLAPPYRAGIVFRGARAQRLVGPFTGKVSGVGDGTVNPQPGFLHGSLFLVAKSEFSTWLSFELFMLFIVVHIFGPHLADFLLVCCPCCAARSSNATLGRFLELGVCGRSRGYIFYS